jgi:two-component system CheB/CheR fusion protein
VAVVRNLQVVIWNRRAEDMWGLRAHETIGQPLVSLDFGLPLVQLLDPLRCCIAGTSGPRDVTVNATDRASAPLRCRGGFHAAHERS